MSAVDRILEAAMTVGTWFLVAAFLSLAGVVVAETIRNWRNPR